MTGIFTSYKVRVKCKRVNESQYVSKGLKYIIIVTFLMNLIFIWANIENTNVNSKNCKI